MKTGHVLQSIFDDVSIYAQYTNQIYMEGDM